MTGHLSCADCDGRGFIRAGGFADRSFPRCPVCDGLGQAYLAALPPPVLPNPDCAPWLTPDDADDGTPFLSSAWSYDA